MGSSNLIFDSDINGHPTDQQLRYFQNRLLQQSSCGPPSLSDGAHSGYSALRSQNYLRQEEVRPYDAIFLRNKLHWLRVPQRVKFKCCLLIYKALHEQAPTYIRQFCTNVTEVQRRSTLRSEETQPSHPAEIKTKFGNRSFSVAGPAARNSLPDDIRTSPSLIVFKNRLKTHLFREPYSSLHCQASQSLAMPIQRAT